MICSKCGTNYDDSYAYCPHCGDKTLESTKECPYCAETIKADAIKCRFCHSFLNAETPATEYKEAGIEGSSEHKGRSRRADKPPARLISRFLVALRSAPGRIRRRLTPRSVFFATCLIVSVVAISLTVFFVIRYYQGQHYQAGQDALTRQDYETALVELSKAGGYRNASGLLELTKNYANALDLMKSGVWSGAYSLLKEIAKVDNGFQEVAGKIDYIEHCPQSPVSFSLWQLLSKAPNVRFTSVEVRNLIGKKIDSISFMPGWTYTDHGGPNLISTVWISVGSSTILAASGQSRYQKPGQQFVVARPGVQFSMSDGLRNFHFTVTDASVTQNPALPDGGHGSDPIFASLSLEIEVSPK